MELVNIKKQRGEFFRILAETDLSQVAVMTVESGRDSGPEELHPGDQIIFILEGRAEATVGDKRFPMTEGDLAIVPARTRHHIFNPGPDDLFFLTIYAPPAY